MGNKCPGGFDVARKRKYGNWSERYVEDEEPYAILTCHLLPIQIWEQIFNYLKEDGNELLKCRQVCRLWRYLADITLEKRPLWMPVYPYVSNVPLLFLGELGKTVYRQVRGTKINSAQSLQRFMEDNMYRCDNPFPSRSVLLFSSPDLCIPSKQPRHGFYHSLPAFLELFGVHIWKLEYGIREDSNGSVNLLKHFFDLPYLKTLTIYARDWNKKRIRTRMEKVEEAISARLRRDEEDFLSKLTELQVLGCNGIIALNYVFSRIGSQLESLYFCLHDDASTIQPDGTVSPLGQADGFQASEIDPYLNQALTYSIPELAPNLVKLKVYHVNEDELDRMFPSSGRRLGCLRQISVKLQRPFIRPLNRLARAIDEHCAHSVQMLNVDLSRWPSSYWSSPDAESERDQILSLNANILYRNLLDLHIAYPIFLDMYHVISRFMEKCPNLKMVTFISVCVSEIRFPRFEWFSSRIWEKLPKSVEKVSAKYWSTFDTIDSPEPATHKQRGSQKKPPLLKVHAMTQTRVKSKIKTPKKLIIIGNTKTVVEYVNEMD